MSGIDLRENIFLRCRSSSLGSGKNPKGIVGPPHIYDILLDPHYCRENIFMIINNAMKIHKKFSKTKRNKIKTKTKKLITEYIHKVDRCFKMDNILSSSKSILPVIRWFTNSLVLIFFEDVGVLPKMIKNKDLSVVLKSKLQNEMVTCQIRKWVERFKSDISEMKKDGFYIEVTDNTMKNVLSLSGENLSDWVRDNITKGQDWGEIVSFFQRFYLYIYNGKLEDVFFDFEKKSSNL